MLYLQSIVVYSLLALGMFFSAYMANKQPKYKALWMAIPIILFTFVFGLRYGVGMDYNAYTNIYENQFNDMSLSQMLQEDTHIEKGFLILIYLCHALAMPTYLFFTVIAFIQILLIYKAFKEENEVLPYIYLTCILTGVAIYNFMNVMRQVIAFGFFLLAIKAIRDNHLWKYLLLCVFAFLFHKSAIILFPLYFIWMRKKEIFHHPPIEVMILLTFFVVSFLQYWQQLLSIFDTLIILIGYEDYIDVASDMFTNSRIGVTRIVTLLMNILIIWNSKQIKDYYQNDLLNIIYDIYFVGVCLGYLFLGSMMFGRINLYFANCAFIMQGYTLAYLTHTYRFSWGQFVKYVYTLVFILITYSGILYHAVDTTDAYVFYFQAELHQTKDNIRQDISNRIR